jgi:hypothetical protein
MPPKAPQGFLIFFSNPEALNAVLIPSDEMPQDAVKVEGFKFGSAFSLSQLLASYATTGFQATALSQGIEIINEMLHWRGEEEKEKTKIFLGYTSNLVSSGLREVFFLLSALLQLLVLGIFADHFVDYQIHCGEEFGSCFSLFGWRN